MIVRSTWLHLRIPFSFFLLPIYLFALSVAEDFSTIDALLIFFILHFSLYPASNGYNSFFDKDEGSIGGLEHPPPVQLELYRVSLLLDVVAIILGLIVSVEFAIMLFIYGMVSKAYSHPSIRLKKYAIGSWLVAGFFQGFFTFLMVYVGVNETSLLFSQPPEMWLGATLASLMLWGSYPMTQIYQHDEDAKRGDFTLSYRLGVLGTFHFTAIFFGLATLGFWLYYRIYFGELLAGLYLTSLLPVLGYFSYWYIRAREDRSRADFRHTMRLNFLSSLCLNLFFGLMVIWDWI
ncbi:UbiA family prenyltransferase [Tunicatimonas pelagia]|uniref:UbiA family prenyltransferase n=1 Tax=Tunicatimonas pelagia TaxID=931531 RepID=UPI0026663F1E|nr:UbiA family prenyltransferase [Tunicatimonas pelagia]WKN45802.1 UbiA family prenyltransferase [Tunicatimonas pelagia]